ncbi:hypothetical protein HOLDEFILI_03368 [Holdemania filiformis DSM 12042]|uniref:Uncharacterized protein n=1 Tax=Holdemania filiformis DSM 12042 TaxID=545696 RepID=B9YC10_9FIRM|nr:hypothetical protein HOLDEFILI_03368 [Holdemania filiformis DSM 12042]
MVFFIFSSLLDFLISSSEAESSPATRFTLCSTRGSRHFSASRGATFDCASFYSVSCFLTFPDSSQANFALSSERTSKTESVRSSAVLTFL